MPGHAGNFLARLFGLSENFMPLMPKTMLQHFLQNKQPMPKNFNKLDLYRFSQVSQIHKSWQDFHRAWADYLDYHLYSALNLLSNTRLDYIYGIHPQELADYFHMPSTNGPTVLYPDTEFLQVELSPEYNHWVTHQQSKLGFKWRPGELTLYQQMKQFWPMHTINLDKMLDTESEFLEEYHRVSALMKIQTQTSQAVELWHDWTSIRLHGEN
jgi:hypothetical protein